MTRDELIAELMKYPNVEVVWGEDEGYGRVYITRDNIKDKLGVIKGQKIVSELHPTTFRQNREGAFHIVFADDMWRYRPEEPNWSI